MASSSMPLFQFLTRGFDPLRLLACHAIGRFKHRADRARAKQAVISLPERPRTDPAHYLSVVTIARNEGRYLREWLEFQRLMGVEHVYLYDNGSTDNSAELVAPFVASGFVTWIPWAAFDQFVSPQRQAYAHALCNFGPRFRWMAFIDLDEFLYPVSESDLVGVLKRYEDCSCLVVPWLMFGFSGHETPPDGLLIENYTQRAPYPCPPDRQMYLMKFKSIVHPSAVKEVNSAHLFGLADGISEAVDERRIPVSQNKKEAEPGASSGKILRINHYFTRSRSEFREKMDIAKFATSDKSHMAHTGPRKRQLIAGLIEVETMYDDTICRFVPMLRRRLNDEGS